MVFGKKFGISIAIVGVLAGWSPSSVRVHAQASNDNTYVVVYSSNASLAAARAALAALGATIVKENASVGVATVESARADFLEAVAAQPALLGGTRNRPIGQLPDGDRKIDDAERDTLELRNRPPVVRSFSTRAARSFALTAGPPPDPLVALQWDMAMIHATSSELYAKHLGDRRVLVGIMDTGVDGTHPDLSPNFSNALSRNFVTDIPAVDGPCEVPTCVDPANVDENGHGTHVAGTIGAALNGLGIAGVAPNVTLVNVRAGQDSGYFFLQPTVDALTYAGDAGIDVVNMSFFVDPWLYNCAVNPADSPAQQAEQRAIIEGVQRALKYARDRRVTLVAALGNQHTDLGNPTQDFQSPNFPPGTEYFRVVDNSCLTVPAESSGVISVSAVGPSGAKADYSNYGVEQTDVSAPGGYFRDFFGTAQYRTDANLVLSTYPRAVLEADGALNPDGLPNTSAVVRNCVGSVCGYYVYLQGTSMAAPHAAGVAALIVSRFGVAEGRTGTQLTMFPSEVEKTLKQSATDTACPTPRLMDYTIVGRPAEFNAFCDGTPAFNGFYGEGIVNALKAITPPPFIGPTR